MYSVYQHWDPLKVCVVGRSYPPEFYSWITVPHVRSLMEKIAIETEEDYQNIIRKLQEFGVEVVRPKLIDGGEFIVGTNLYEPPPMTPRDYMVMIGNKFYSSIGFSWHIFYNDIKDPLWPDYKSLDEFIQTAPSHIQEEVYKVHDLAKYIKKSSFFHYCYEDIFELIENQNNVVKYQEMNSNVNGAMVSRIGKDLYFGTPVFNQDIRKYKKELNAEFTETRNHVINTGGHADGVYCPVCPGLIISLCDISTYAKTFPDWEVVYLPNQSWTKVKSFLDLKEKNRGKWWIPGFEHDDQVIETIETWLGHWTGYVEETVFDVNMLIIDPKNVMVFNYNKQVFDALNRYGITPHIVPFRHRYFWDGGIHCVTLDLHREGVMQDYFPNRT